MSEAAYIKALKFTFAHEGEYSNDPTDSGGPTKWGVSQQSINDMLASDSAFLHSIGITSSSVAAMKQITRDQAAAIFRHEHWEPLRCDAMPDSIAIAVFDFGMNAGNHQSIRTLQRAYNRTHVGEGLLSVDGYIGPQTLRAAAQMDNSRDIRLLLDARQDFYEGLVAKKPRKYSPFIRGWTKRVNDLRKYLGV